jgi:uncharacterized RDD family membrane protein YckC
VKLASAGQRFAARLIDSAIYLVVLLVLIGAKVGVASGGGVTRFAGVTFVVAMLVLGYETLLIGLTGQTLGKMALGVKVVRTDNGEVPGIGKAFLRTVIPDIAWLLCGLLTLLVYLSPFFDGTKRLQGWHDKIAGDFVISLK